ncbi:MAG TPA: hypothetical protein VK888_01415 [Anaerolineales bacterium]|nr:hypothetical protein [Anaerolineales bacterium]
MALRFDRTFFVITLLLMSILIHVPSGRVQAMTDDFNDESLPGMDAFVGQVRNGQSGELRGIYIPGILAAPIVQQPRGMEEFVSPWQNIVTQFGLASNYGSTGLLAHNYLAGKSFHFLQPGQEIQLVYGDGRVATFIVSEILHYQALEPDSTSSSFIDLDTGEAQSYASLFSRIYHRPGQVVFQTCISAGEDIAWGRLFVIAEPA